MERIGPRVWIIALAVVVALFAGVVLVLNLTLFSASGFVTAYLGALARHDVESAMAMPGVTLPGNGSRALLRGDAMNGLEDIQIVSDSTTSNGDHRVTVQYRAGTAQGKTTFVVRRDGTDLGLFNGWRFAESPAATIVITPQNASAFTVNGLDLTASDGASTSTNYAVLSPSSFTLSYRSYFLVATPKTTLVDVPGSTKNATVDIEASDAFVAEVQKETDAYLKKCVTQQVLLPTGCPMGQQIQDRVQNAPVWSMVDYPTISIESDNTPGTWLAQAAGGTAHLTVTVKSIFDGSVSTFDQDVPFTVAYHIVFQADGSLVITPQF